MKCNFQLRLLKVLKENTSLSLQMWFQKDLKGRKGKANILLPSFKPFNFEKEADRVLRDPGTLQ